MVLQLPLEVWNAIADFIHSESLSQVCQVLRAFLGSGRYMKVDCYEDQIAERAVKHVDNLRSLQLQDRSLGEGGAQALAQ